jgi:hypothetical protein
MGVELMVIGGVGAARLAVDAGETMRMEGATGGEGAAVNSMQVGIVAGGTRWRLVTLKTWFHPVWYRKYHKYFYRVQILWSHRFISIPTYKMHHVGVIFKFQRTIAHQQQKVLYNV